MSRQTQVFLVFLASAVAFALAAVGWPHTTVSLSLLGVALLVFGFAVERAP